MITFGAKGIINRNTTNICSFAGRVKRKNLRKGTGGGAAEEDED